MHPGLFYGLGIRRTGMDFQKLRRYLESEGYVMYTDPLLQDKAENFGECHICRKLYTLISFAKNGSYKHFILCPDCGSYAEV